MAKLDPRIEAIRKQYGLADDAFWELPQKRGTWVAKHSALEAVAVAAKIEFMPPQVIEANGANGACAMVVEGRTEDGRTEWSTGEASPKNNKNSYPWAMAEKRAKDRVILKLVGLHGLVYSEDEGDFTLSKQASRATYSSLEKDVRQCASTVALAAWWKNPDVQATIKSMHPDFQADIIKEKDRHKAELQGKATSDFPGDQEGGEPFNPAIVGV